VWTFGDGTPSSLDRASIHTYALPSSYDVKVTGAGTTAGMMSQVMQLLRRSLIVVQPGDRRALQRRRPMWGRPP
jgi:hypothetical protein